MSRPSIRAAILASDLRPTPAELLATLALVGAHLPRQRCAECDREQPRHQLAPCSHDDCAGRGSVIYCRRCRAHVGHGDDR